MDIIELVASQKNYQKSNSKLLAKARLFNPFDAEFQQNLYPIYHRLRAEEPIHKSFTGLWVLTRYDDIIEVIQDPRFSSKISRQKELAATKSDRDNDLIEEFSNNLIANLDPPRHNYIRKTISKAFRSNIIATIDSSIREHVTQIFNKVANNGQMDIVEDLATVLPIKVIVELIGFPKEDWQKIKKWSQKISYIFEYMLSRQKKAEIEEALGEFKDYIKHLISIKQNNPESDFISRLIKINNQDHQLNEEELITSCIFFVIAGEESTSAQIASSVLNLLLFPEQMNKLRTDHTLIPQAVEELIRYDSAIQVMSRTALENINFKGKNIHKHQQVLLLLGAANRDPKNFVNPDLLDITRNRNKHLAFSAGIHNCLGANLARLEIKIVLETLLQEFSHIQLLKNKLEWQDSLYLRSVKSLPIKFTLA